jgi:polysaccharide biosynthesis/export protein
MPVNTRLRVRQWILLACLVGAWLDPASALAQQPSPAPAGAAASGTVVKPPPDYVIGPEDQLSVLFWVDKGMSADVIVRPDGKISLPLINEIQAAGLTPEQLRQSISAEAKRFVQDPNATILVRQINSRKVFITGAVERPGPYPLMSPSTVLQLIATAGGLREYADSKRILIIRNEGGRTVTFKFNYREVVAQKNLKQNIELRPGDMVLVP